VTQAGTSLDVEREIIEVRGAFLEALASEHPLVVVKAPPGSGKSYLIRQGAALVRGRRRRVAIAAQTNSQADDLCRRLAVEYPRVQVVRWLSSDAIAEPLGRSVESTSDAKRLPHGPAIVVATAAKWGLARDPQEFDVLLVDEAWQMAWSDFMLLSQVASRFVLVGDPGQIDPVVSIDVSRWATSRRPPHTPTPERLLAMGDEVPLMVLELPASRRLPPDTVDVVQAFYDFPFSALAEPSSRRLVSGPGGRDPVDPVIDLLNRGSISALTIPTPDVGPPLEDDREIAQSAANVVRRLVERGGVIEIDGKRVPLTGDTIGMCATHRILGTRMREALPPALRDVVAVDTPERWQGLERPLMVVVHPVSGAMDPSSFDLATGRLCVMASRHQVGLVIVTRDHIGATLEAANPGAEQHVGGPDLVGRGLAQHRQFWSSLEAEARVVALEAS
jgi:hypothetical protein